jgi:hypothetical protein
MPDLPPPVARLIDAANANDTDAVRGWSDAEFIGVRVSRMTIRA